MIPESKVCQEFPWRPVNAVRYRTSRFPMRIQYDVFELVYTKCTLPIEPPNIAKVSIGDWLKLSTHFFLVGPLGDLGHWGILS